MTDSNDRDIRQLLACYTVPEPSPDLIARTLELMHHEIAFPAVVPVYMDIRVFVLVALSVALSLGAFYVMTVGTLLRLVLPATMLGWVGASYIAFSAVGGIILALTVMIAGTVQLHAVKGRGWRPVAVTRGTWA